jgi:RimJ/RimL family protein N-acetyltransferase
MLNKNITLNGTCVNMRTINESHFTDIIRWRNDPEINQYLNQPYELTPELQSKWYNETYLQSSDLLFVMVEKSSGKSFGTLGFNDLDMDKRRAIAGRLLVGEKRYRRSPELLEANLLFYDFLFEVLDLQYVYCHIVTENKSAIAFDTRLGFVPNVETVFPQYCKVRDMSQIEMVNTKGTYYRCREKLVPILKHYFESL